jgi:hypothetical protein
LCHRATQLVESGLSKRIFLIHGNPISAIHVRKNMGTNMPKRFSFAFAVAAALFVWVPARAADIVNQGGGTLADIVDGGGTSTIITLVNLQSAANFSTPATVAFTLSFYADNGSPLTLSTNVGTIAGSYFGALAAGGSLVIQTNGTGSTVVEGYAVLSTAGFAETSTGIVTSLGSQIAGSAVFSVPWNGMFPQASCPLDTGENFVIDLPFDETGDTASSLTGVAIVNSPGDAPFEPTGVSEQTNVNLTFFDQNGSPIPVSEVPAIILAPGQHTSFVLDQSFPELIGRQGTVVFTALGDTSGKNYIVKVLGLRFTPTTFTSITPIIPCIPETYSNGTYFGCGNDGGVN